MRFHHLNDWLTWLATLHPKNIDLGLERSQKVAARIPQLLKFNCPIITIAGTNGKGSCAALLEAMYLAAGYKVGTYTSPHLFCYNERVRINGNNIDDESLCMAFAKIDHARENTSLTYFEFGTLAALYCFKQQPLDIIILEVGLGGRLDAVNIVDPDLAIITTIDIDHTNWLGNNRGSIGLEKAGILRRDKLAICGDFNPPQSLVNYAKSINAEIYYQQQQFSFLESTNDWSWHNQSKKLTHLPKPTLPLQNAAVALQATTLLPLSLDITAIKDGLQTTLAGRIQRITTPENVLQIFDVAHNPQATAYLATKLQKEKHQGKTYAVIAMLKDKDIASSLAPLQPIIDKWFIADLDVERGAKADFIASLISKNHHCFPSPNDAHQAAIAEANPHDRIIIFGSFYTVAEILG